MNYSAPKLVAITLSKVKRKYITFINNILTSNMTFVSIFKLQILERYNFSHHFTPAIFASYLGFWRLLNQCAGADSVSTCVATLPFAARVRADIFLAGSSWT